MKRTSIAIVLLLVLAFAVGCAKSYDADARRNAVKQSSEHNARKGMSELDRETK